MKRLATPFDDDTPPRWLRCHFAWTCRKLCHMRGVQYCSCFWVASGLPAMS